MSEIRALAQAESYQPPRRTVTFEGRAPAHLVQNAEFRQLWPQPSWPQNPPVANAWLGEPVEIKAPTQSGRTCCGKVITLFFVAEECYNWE